ncbi:MAG: hypothetical protein ABSC51_09695 [Gaiellaceae bacterium]
MKLGVFFGVLTAFLAAVPVAFGAGAAQAVYGGTEGVSQAQVQHQVAATASSSSALPFTGLDLVLLGGGGLLLLLAGIALYLISRPRATA